MSTLWAAHHDRVPSYYSLIVGSPDETARIAADKVRAGYPRIQIKVGGRNLEKDATTVHKVWEAVGLKASIVVDGNRGLSVASALHLDRLCQNIPFVFEQPCNSMEEIAAVRGRGTHPIYLDENTEDLNAVLRAISSGIADGLPQSHPLGRTTKMMTARDMCAIRCCRTLATTRGGDIIAAACVHLASTVEPRRLKGPIAQEYIDGHYDNTNPVALKMVTSWCQGAGPGGFRSRGLGVPVASHGCR